MTVDFCIAFLACTSLASSHVASIEHVAWGSCLHMFYPSLKCPYCRQVLFWKSVFHEMTGICKPLQKSVQSSTVFFIWLGAQSDSSFVEKNQVVKWWVSILPCDKLASYFIAFKILPYNLYHLNLTTWILMPLFNLNRSDFLASRPCPPSSSPKPWRIFGSVTHLAVGLLFWICVCGLLLFEKKSYMFNLETKQLRSISWFEDLWSFSPFLSDHFKSSQGAGPRAVGTAWSWRSPSARTARELGGFWFHSNYWCLWQLWTYVLNWDKTWGCNNQDRPSSQVWAWLFSVHGNTTVMRGDALDPIR